MKLAVFGTSSNPFCLHHGQCVRWLIDGGFDLVLVVPSAAHALKTDLPSFHHRLALARAGVESLALPGRVEVTDLEHGLAVRGGVVYAYDLLRAVRARWGADFAEIKFSIGPDIPAELHRWKFVAEIEREFGFVHTPSFGHHATEARRKIANGDPSWRDLVSSSVAEYIERHEIYPGRVPPSTLSISDG